MFTQEDDVKLKHLKRTTESSTRCNTRMLAQVCSQRLRGSGVRRTVRACHCHFFDGAIAIDEHMTLKSLWNSVQITNVLQTHLEQKTLIVGFNSSKKFRLRRHSNSSMCLRRKGKYFAKSSLPDFNFSQN
eukprot:4527945-Amphidinium_carterae.1